MPILWSPVSASLLSGLIAVLAGAAHAQPADCPATGVGPTMTLGVDVRLDGLPAPPGNQGGRAWVGMHDVPSQGSVCEATPLPAGDALYGPQGDVLHGPPAPGGLLAGAPPPSSSPGAGAGAGTVDVAPPRPLPPRPLPPR